jgi:UDP-N-acetylmuramate dehydrogenase
VGGAQVSTLHANFIVHDGAARGAKAADVAGLMGEVQQRVREASGVTLIPEVEWWGDGAPPQVFQVARASQSG